MSPEFSTAMAYDPSRRVVVAVVQPQYPVKVADRWTWDGARWQQSGGEGSFEVNTPALGYDEAHGTLLLAGVSPHDGGTVVTWVFRGSEWDAVSLTPAAVHDPIVSLRLAYDRIGKRLLLFRASADANMQVLAWDGSTWADTGIDTPYGSVVPDPNGDGLLDLVGDSGPRARGVWRWDGQHWSRVAPLPVPAAVTGWEIAPDPDAHQLVLFGGSESNGGWQPVEKPSNRTWTFDGTSWTMRGGSALPKLPPPATPPPPPPCTGHSASVLEDPSRDGVAEFSITLPLTGPPGACVPVTATLRLETTNHTLLAVGGNPAELLDYPYAPASATVSWSNWCGTRIGTVLRLVGAGFDITHPVAALPSCVFRSTPSTLQVSRLSAIP